MEHLVEQWRQEGWPESYKHDTPEQIEQNARTRATICAEMVDCVRNEKVKTCFYYAIIGDFEHTLIALHASSGIRSAILARVCQFIRIIVGDRNTIAGYDALVQFISRH